MSSEKLSNFRTAGFYICERIRTPDYLNIKSTEMLTVSACFGDIHPKWEVFMGRGCWLDGEEEEYKRLLGLNEEEYLGFSNKVGELFDNGRIDVDGRFIFYYDAAEMYERYFSLDRFRLVSISAEEKYFDVLKNELNKGSFCSGVMNGDEDTSELLGYDILGWDYSNYHSFLCNNLHEGLPDIRFNDLCLLDNDYEEVCGFADMIKGFGEPVEWLPFRIGKP